MDLDQKTLWALIYANLCAMRIHPGYEREGAQRPSLQDVAAMSDRAVLVAQERLQALPVKEWD